MEEGFFQFSLLTKFPEIVHAVSKRVYGNMKEGWGRNDSVIKNKKHFFGELGINPSRVVAPQIVHSKVVKVASSQNIGRPVLGADGLVTSEKGLFLLVTLADCFPIFIYDPVAQTVGLAHAGWRGIAGKIVISLIEQMKNLGSDADNLIVGVGPGICQKHFVVKNDVLSLFKDDYPQATFVRNHDGYVDLRKAIVGDLQALGVNKHNIEVSHDCPVCLNGIYGSYRKEGENAPASAAVIGMINE